MNRLGVEASMEKNGEGRQGCWCRIPCQVGVRGLVGKVHIFRRSGFTKTLLCIPVMSPLHSSELLV